MRYGVYGKIRYRARKLSSRARIAITPARIRLSNADKLDGLERFEARVHSQQGEDGVIAAIFAKIGTTDRFCMEFGVEDGFEDNTRYLVEKKGWRYLHMDGKKREKTVGDVKVEFITAENINQILEKYRVPEVFDLLSVDIDYNTYWVWKAMKCRPRVVVVEYNATVKPTQSVAVRYDPERVWDGTNYFGASLLAYQKLGREKGYELVYCEKKGVNAFFVERSLALEHFQIRGVEELYRRPDYGWGPRVDGQKSGHFPSTERMIDV